MVKNIHQSTEIPNEEGLSRLISINFLAGRRKEGWMMDR